MNNKREQEILAAAHKKDFGKEIPAHLKSGKHDEGSLLQSLSKKRSMASKMSGKQQSREASSKKAGFYVHGHKNYGDVYEA